MVLVCAAAAMLYGVLHDQVTVSVCLESFTVTHPPLCPACGPQVLALQWGALGTWWVGTTFGVLLARSGRGPDGKPPAVRDVLPSIAALLGVMALAALGAGAVGHFAGHRMPLPAALQDAISSDRARAFWTVWFAHGASYATGIAGGALVIRKHGRRGGRMERVLPAGRAAWMRVALLLSALAGAIWLTFT